MVDGREFAKKFEVIRCPRFWSKKLGRYVYAKEVGLPWFTFVFERKTPANDVDAPKSGGRN